MLDLLNSYQSRGRAVKPGAVTVVVQFGQALSLYLFRDDSSIAWHFEPAGKEDLSPFREGSSLPLPTWTKVCYK
jgi:hypothetical protein